MMNQTLLEAPAQCPATLYTGTPRRSTALLLLSGLWLILFSRYLIPEVLLSFCLCVALYCLLCALEDPVATTLGARFMQSHRMSGHSREDANRTPSHNPKSVISTLSEVERAGARTAEVEKSASRLSPATHAYLMSATLALAVLAKGLVALVFFFVSAI